MSYKNSKPNYLTRASKHIERKIFIETLQCLSKAQYDISDYHYIGFGSYYYVDFILFNRFLSIDKMTCLEKESSIEKRMKFNKPFRFIDFLSDNFTSHVSTLRGDRNYFVWTDYEDKLNNDKLNSIQALVNTLKNGSIFIITVNADLKQDMPYLDQETTRKIRKKQGEKMLSVSKENLYPFCEDIKGSDMTPKELPNIYARTIINCINDSLSGRLGDKFHQLFNYVYQDGTRMLSVGGVIDKKDKEQDIKQSIKKLDYINTSIKPAKIMVPQLTIREKLYLDAKIQKNGKINSIPFELEKDEVKDYIKYSKHYPTFYEVFTG